MSWSWRVCTYIRSADRGDAHARTREVAVGSRDVALLAFVELAVAAREEFDGEVGPQAVCDQVTHDDRVAPDSQLRQRREQSGVECRATPEAHERAHGVYLHQGRAPTGKR